MQEVQSGEPRNGPQGPSGLQEQRHDPIPLCSTSHQAVTQNMDSVFKELLGKATMRQATAASPGPRSPKSPGGGGGGGGGVLGRNKGFARGPSGPGFPTFLNLQGPDLAPKPQ